MRQLPPPKRNKNNQTQNFFGKEESLILSSMAILLMIWHHLFNFPEWYTDGTGWNSALGFVGNRLTTIVAGMGNICVPMFAIMSGYALLANPEAYRSWKARGIRLLKFLGTYWLVFAIFLIVGYFNGDVMPTSSQFFENIFGLNTGPCKWVNVSHAWYVAFYIEFILFVPVLTWAFGGKSLWKDTLAYLCLVGFVYLVINLPVSGLLKRIFATVIPLMNVGIGVIFAKYNLFEKLHDLMMKKIPSIFLIISTCGIILLRYQFNRIDFEGLIPKIFTYFVNALLPLILVTLSVETISRVKSIHLRKPFILLGSLSMYLWFLHGILSTGGKLLQPELYSLKEPLLIFTVCLAALFPIAYLLKILNDRVLIRKLFP